MLDEDNEKMKCGELCEDGRRETVDARHGATELTADAGGAAWGSCKWKEK